MKITTYTQARTYLENFISFTIYQRSDANRILKDPLERMRVLLSLLDNPQEKFKSILIGGTSGKGSTAYLTSHILRTAGYKTGLFIKPHLHKINERIQLNGLAIDDKQLVTLLNKVIPAVNQMETMRAGQPSYFEILVAMAFLYFAQEKVDIAVVEVGMGGEYDATNTLYPLISVITNVSLDHTEFLGDTVEKIAKTKAEIIKKVKSEERRVKSKKLIVITAAKQESVKKIIEDRSKKVDATLYQLGKDFHYQIKKTDIHGSVFTFSEKGYKSEFHISLIGDYQVENASLALEIVFNLVQFGFPLSDLSIQNALQTASFPGRFEIINYKLKNSSTLLAFHFRLILDGAHNPEKMYSFLKSLRTLFPQQKKIFVVAFKKSKDITAMLKEIIPVADYLILTEFHATTDMAKNESMKISNISRRGGIPRLRGQYSISNTKTKNKIIIDSDKNSKNAFEKALEIAKKEPGAIIIVTGSLYLVGEVRSILIKVDKNKEIKTNVALLV